MSKLKAIVAVVALNIASSAAITYAQDGGQPNDGNQGRQRDRGGNNQGGNNDRGGRGNWDPAEFQRRMMERIKEELKAPDDEWGVIQPKLEKVFTAQRESRAGGMFGGGRRGGGGGGGGDQQDNSPLGVAARELRTELQKDNPSEATIEQKLAAYRDARAKAQANLESARKDLKDVLTARQEASLVMMGVLE
jgi:Spy/CpxP family protein refolding chaperone